MRCKSRQASLFKGLFFAMLSGVAFSIISVIVKLLKNLHPGQVALYKFVGTFLLTIPATTKIGQNPLGHRDVRFYLVLRGICGGVGHFLTFIAFRNLGLGEASVIILSSPVVVTVFARILFKEPSNIFQAISVVLTVVGIVFTTKLPARLSEISLEYSSEKVYGFAAAVIALFCISAIHLITRKIRNVHQDIMTFNFCWVGIIGTALLTAIFGDYRWHYCGLQILYILLLPVFSYSGITLAVMAFQCEYAGPVSTVRAAADIGMAFLFQVFLFNDVPDVYGIVGAILVLVSIICIGLDKWISSWNGNLWSCTKYRSVPT